ncbi:phage holin family protein [Lactobacillus sp.]|uniref:phage holin family protein n=1 Tax=Lactobacillus sp. TaxID=1591 RepID=UPI0019AC34F6|nr:phage holin family protein [Lactobacillus sp.]MBD5429352.1 holin [Lactobacillus sp.]
MSSLTFLTNYLSRFTHLVDDPLMWGFTLVVLIDLVLDLIRPLYVKGASLKGTGSKSISRNAITFIVIATGYPYLSLIGAEKMAITFLIAFIYQYLVWIITTWEEIGWWLPAPLVKFVKTNASETELENILNKENKKDDSSKS